MVDYTKWDKMDFSDDEEHDKEHSFLEPSTRNPKVTKLDRPSRIQITGNGSLHVTESNVNTTKPSKPIMNGNSSPKTRSSSTSYILNLSKNGGYYTDPTDKYTTTFWSQDHYEVILNVLYNPSLHMSKNIRVSVSKPISYVDRHTAVGTGKYTSDVNVENMMGILVVWDISKTTEKDALLKKSNDGDGILLHGDLSYFVHLSEEEDSVEWEIADFKYEYRNTDESEYKKSNNNNQTNDDVLPTVKREYNKMIRITLLKATPMPNVTIWWKKPLVHYPEIDVTTIEARNKSRNSHTKNTSNQTEQIQPQRQSFEDTWKEAHRLFKEKIQNR